MQRPDLHPLFVEQMRAWLDGPGKEDPWVVKVSLDPRATPELLFEVVLAGGWLLTELHDLGFTDDQAAPHRSLHAYLSVECAGVEGKPDTWSLAGTALHRALGESMLAQLGAKGVAKATASWERSESKRLTRAGLLGVEPSAQHEPIPQERLSMAWLNERLSALVVSPGVGAALRDVHRRATPHNHWWVARDLAALAARWNPGSAP